MAVNGENEYFFLEANPFGQFMAYEESLPETQLLAKSVKLMLDKAGVDHTSFDFEDITTKKFLSSFSSNDLEKSIDNGDYIHDVIVRKSLSLANI